MKYAKDGSLKKNLQNIAKENWIKKLVKLQEIISGLNTIHKQELVHCDFHHGNILNQQDKLSISDLGLCKPVQYFQSHFRKNDIYGVLPFIAPEILRGKPYTTASDIYSFSMIMWEFTSGTPPFDDRAHDFQLSISVYKGERPKIIENTPQCYIDLMEKCWNKDPLKRPNASEVQKIIKDWISIIKDWISIITLNIKKSSKNIFMEFYEADKFLKQKQTNVSNTFGIINNKSHSEAYHTSRLLDFTTKLNEILDQEDMEIYDYKNDVYETEISRKIPGGSENSQSIGNYYNIY